MPDQDLTVFVVDDDEDIRSSLTRALNKRGYQVETYSSALVFLDAYDGKRPGCLVLDQGMPDMSGLELQRRLKELGYPIPIIFITGHGGVPESVAAIKAGAVDFLEKPFRQLDLIDRIESAFAIASKQLAGLEEMRKLQQRFNKLTAREQEIVDRMVEMPSETSSKEIGSWLGISPRTVDHHRARILEKLDVRSVAELIAVAQKFASLSREA